MNYYKSLALFAGGVLFGSAGIKLLSSKDAKKVYTHTTAAALRMKDCVMGTVTTVQENAADILASAKDINQERAAREEIVEDAAEETQAAPEPEYISKNGRYDADRRGREPSLFPFGGLTMKFKIVTSPVDGSAFK